MHLRIELYVLLLLMLNLFFDVSAPRSPQRTNKSRKTEREQEHRDVLARIESLGKIACEMFRASEFQMYHNQAISLMGLHIQLQSSS